MGCRAGRRPLDRERALRARSAGKAQRGDRLSLRTDTYAEIFAAALAATPDPTLLEMKERLAAQGVSASVTALWRDLRRHDLTREESVRAAKQDLSDLLTRRKAWFEGQLALGPERLAFLDETWAKLASHGGALGLIAGERQAGEIVSRIPHPLLTPLGSTDGLSRSRL